MKQITILFLFISLIVTGFSQNVMMKTQHFENNFILLDSTYILLPISWTGTGKFNDVKIESSSEYNIKNIIFYNIINDSCRYLFKDSMQIIRQIKDNNYYRNYTEFSLNIIKDSIHANLKPNQEERQPKYTFNNYLLFQVINEDYNQDGKLNLDDPVYLYASKSDGTGLIPITPKFYSFKYYQFFKKENFILAVLAEDTNKDKKFDNNDMEVVYKINLTDFKKSKIIVDLQIKRKQ
jgi:hypothetical protein